MKLHRRLSVTSVLTLALICGAPAPTPAQWAVFDASNYAQNVLSAARALEQIQHQVTALQNQSQMLINQARQLASLPTSVQGEIGQSFAQIQQLLRQADRIAYDVQAIEQAFQQSYPTSINAATSDQQMIAGARERWRTSVSAFQHSLTVGAGAVSNLPQVQAQTGTLVSASQSSVGVLQATQAGNQLLAVQSQQLSDLTAMLAAQGRAQALDDARKAAAEEQAREQFRRFTARNGYQPQPVQMFHD